MEDFKYVFKTEDGKFIKKTITCTLEERDAKVDAFAEECKVEGISLISSHVEAEWPAEFVDQAEHGA
jgi:hypothetical protein